MNRSRVVRWTAAATLALTCGACEGITYDAQTPGTGTCSGTVHLAVTTRVSSASARYMLLGDRSPVRFSWSCGGGDVPGATIVSSDAEVVAIVGDSIVAASFGSAGVVGRAGPFADSVLVRVVRSIADVVYVQLLQGWEGTGAVYDEHNSLVEVSVPVHGSLYPTWSIRVNGDWDDVWVETVSFRSADSSIVAVTPNCRPKEVDPDCEVTGRWWITGMRVGETTVTMSIPHGNATASFVVKVVQGT